MGGVRRGVAVAALAVTALSLLGAPAQAEASRWGSKRVTYRDAAGLPRTVDAAARLWNRSVHGLRLVRARRGERAMIRVVSKPITRCGAIGCGGYPPDGLVELQRQFVRLQTRRPVDQPYNMLRVSIVAHEIGHALGLGHTTNICDAMYPTLGGCRRQVPAGSGADRCGPQQRDARALARLYGVRARRIDGLCRVVPLPRAELAAPGPFVERAQRSAALKNEVLVRVRNRSRRAWGRGAGRLRVVFENIAPGNRFGLCTRETEPRERVVAPGAVATLAVRLCAGEGLTSVRLRPSATLDAGTGYEGAQRDGAPLPAVTVGFDFRPEATLSHDTYVSRTATGWRVGFSTSVYDDSDKRTARLDFGDGSAMNDPAGYVDHEYTAPGTYVATLVVTEPGGESARASTTVQIAPDPPPEPLPPEPLPPEPLPAEPF